MDKNAKQQDNTPFCDIIIEETKTKEVGRHPAYGPSSEHHVMRGQAPLKSNKKKIQLTFENVSIKTIPSKWVADKTIIDNVSGTILPG